MTDFVNRPEFPLSQNEWHTIGRLRTVAAAITQGRQNNPLLSAKLRTPRRDELPWAKSWGEEFYPLKLLSDAKSMPDEIVFRWTPDAAADFEVQMPDQTMRIQSTMAYRELDLGTAGLARSHGHLHHLEMIAINEHGSFFPGGRISQPTVRDCINDLMEWRRGIRSALTAKLDPKYAGCQLLIFAQGCGFDTIDFDFSEVVAPALENVEWAEVFDAIYVIDGGAPVPVLFEALRADTSP